MVEKQIIVGPESHEFVGSNFLCAGILGYPPGHERSGHSCLLPKDARVHRAPPIVRLVEAASSPLQTLTAPSIVASGTGGRTTKSYERIMSDLVSAWADRFRAKNLDYSGQDFEPHLVLGEAGQFAEIWRKVWKLKKSMWDGEELTFEQKEEILQDLIGHCFLALDMVKEGNGGARPWQGKG